MFPRSAESIFNRYKVGYWLKPFKGLSVDYMLTCVFNEEIQNKWIPEVGDIIVGPTGNIFVISGSRDLIEELGGKVFYFGGSACARNGSCILDSTKCYTMNKSGTYISPLTRKEERNWDHSGFKDFRFVPYPHEINRM